MYMIYDVVFGIPITQEIEDAFESLPDEYFDVQPCPCTLSASDGGWFETRYSGCHSHTVGWIGKSVYEYNQGECIMKKMDAAKNSLSEETKQRILDRIDSLPEWIKEIMPDPGWHLVESTS